MTADPRLEEAFRLIRAVVTDAYERGRADQIQFVTELLQSAKISAPADTSGAEAARNIDGKGNIEGSMDALKRKRAPRGSVRKLIDRALKIAGDGGLTTSEIMARRQGTLEEMIAESSVRGELRNGVKDGRYVEEEGRWRFSVFG